MKTYKCQFCNYTISSKPEDKNAKGARYKLGLHYETHHKDLIPQDMTGFRWVYYLLTKKTRGRCVICHGETEFNEINMKYSRFCNNPACKQKYKEERDRRMMSKHGKIHLLDDPDMQKKMQSGRRIAGIYMWSDGKNKFNYLSSYEKDFLRYLDEELHWEPSDIFAPSPHTYTYEYNGKSHFYMPDFYIGSMNLEVEIKDDGSAKNINPESREKDKIKHELMKSLLGTVNYVKIINMNYEEFNKMINKGE